jgi:hypothetical protein
MEDPLKKGPPPIGLKPGDFLYITLLFREIYGYLFIGGALTGTSGETPATAVPVQE